MEESGRRKRSIPDRVHDLYFKVFPGADCPVSGAAREKLISASRSQRQRESADASACSSSSADVPAKPKYKHPHVYDVYGRRIDEEAKQNEEQQVWKMPSCLYTSSVYTVKEFQKDAREEARDFDLINPANRMPLHPNQKPSPGQKELLSTQRQKSTIPKAGTDETWLYPSPQMFYNSLVRKNKADDVTEKDMDAVVVTHNTVNEVTWSKLLQWERLYADIYPGMADEEPRLLHFRGRPNDLTPKAYFKKLFGYGVPFDRHDWTVDRGGREMRYVIDFYYDESKEWPFFVDIRPALDSPAAILVRARMMMQEIAGGVPSPATPKNVDSHGSTT